MLILRELCSSNDGDDLKGRFGSCKFELHHFRELEIIKPAYSTPATPIFVDLETIENPETAQFLPV